MDIVPLFAGGLFTFGYLLITLEQRFSTHKSAIALMLGSALWLLTAVYLRHDADKLHHALEVAGNEIFGVVAFLLAAMALIEILVHYRLFDMVRAGLVRLKVDDKKQFLIILTLTFFLSAGLDNIAITIAMLQIARRFFTGKNLVVAGAAIVIAANAGGAWSPIGDVTTILLWLAGKFTAVEIMTWAFVPAFSLFVVAASLLYRKLDDEDFTAREKGDLARLARSEKLIIGTALASFLLPLAMNSVGLPPYMGLLLGLGVTWGMIEIAKSKRKQMQSHLTANIEKIVQTVDMASIKYIIGILLSVSALATLGVLALLSGAVLGDQPSELRIIVVNIALGLFSSIVDNTSLVAMAIDVFPMRDPTLWSLTALAAGTGGSTFIIGSAAGVVAMGSMKELTFQRYFKIATAPALAGFVIAMVVWYVQYLIFA